MLIMAISLDPAIGRHGDLVCLRALGMWTDRMRAGLVLATHQNKTIFHWPMAKRKLFSVGQWPFMTIKTH